MRNEYFIDYELGEVAIIAKSPGGSEFFVTIDLSDFEKVKSISGSWSIKKDNLVYGFNGVQNKPVALHRWIMRPSEGMVVDHINRDTLDNKRENLRVITPGQNAQNISMSGNKRNKLMERGISVRKRYGKTFYEVVIGGVYLGSYDSLEEAKIIRNEWLPKLQPYAYIN